MSHHYDNTAGTRCTPGEFNWHPHRRYQFPSGCESARNATTFTGRGEAITTVKGGTVCNKSGFQRAIASAHDYVTYCTRHGYSVTTPVTALTNPERLAELSKAKKEAKAKVVRLQAEYTAGPEIVSIDEFLEQENAGELDEAA